MSGPAPLTAPPGGAPGPRCGVCQTAFEAGDVVEPCPDCTAPHHRECWDENGGCAVYGCPRAPATLKAEPELVRSHWGEEEKDCPRCKGRIKVAAVRCRLCGAILSETATGQGASSARSSVPLLVFLGGIVPFTAPFALAGGLLWLLRANRWRRLPPSGKVLLGFGLATATLSLLLLGAVILLGRS